MRFATSAVLALATITHHPRCQAVLYFSRPKPDLQPPLRPIFQATPYWSSTVIKVSVTVLLLFMSYLNSVTLFTTTPQKPCQCHSPSPTAETHCSHRNIIRELDLSPTVATNLKGQSTKRTLHQAFTELWWRNYKCTLMGKFLKSHSMTFFLQKATCCKLFSELKSWFWGGVFCLAQLFVAQ